MEKIRMFCELWDNYRMKKLDSMKNYKMFNVNKMLQDISFLLI